MRGFAPKLAFKGGEAARKMCLIGGIGPETSV
jgi:hypothetical protein